ncbi:MAG: hypothetical protein BGO82_04850 [Devosia sp. 67-54]|uniref:caspase family protein n=1 Tax=unclassified Devosia TaxID=196773 RepID=UPI00095D6DE7|nr:MULTISPECIES: caspase family protein [unclassified Devosia]MBN9307488.1 caspase family protein [Devosia sp.]OJX16864.1 MAG: hypothetical protein BGO82_04850 [Devosia sp. 67-54]
MGNRSRLPRRLMSLLALAPVCFLGTMVAGAAQAGENYALIVAASDYPNLDQKYWLKGPKNDEALIRDYLLGSAPVKFAPQNVVALGSGEGMQLGTHQAILDNLAKLADEAKPGDFIYLHFSGHGTQQPALNDPTEPDGRDEVFLAADAKMAPPDNPKFYPNVLTDDEMSVALKAIRKTGAFVWIVFDSCFSGTMTRGAPGDAMDRKIDPADLGIPDSAFEQPAVLDTTGSNERAVPMAGAMADSDSGADLGGMVAFFAATSEPTQEHGFPVTQADGSTADVPYGIFTYAIFSSLAKNPNQTYRQLAQSVLADYASQNLLRPTPMFEGKLDAPVFGSADAAAAEQWPIALASDNVTMSISAGQLHGLAAGTKLLLLPSPSASDAQALGVMEVTSATELRSTLAVSSDDTHPAIEAAAVPKGAYVRLAQVSYPFELTVSKPDPASTDPAQVAAVSAALDTILADAQAQLKLRVVEPGAPADVRLAVLSDDQVARLSPAATVQKTSYDPTPKLWLLPTSGEVSLEPARAAPNLPMPTSAVARDASFDKALESNLVTIFRATGLSRLSQASTFKPKDFALNFGLQQAGSDQIAAMDPTSTPIVRPGDRLHVELTNASGKPLDFNVLYVDHDYGITLLCQARLAPGDHLFQPMADISDSDAGSERIVAVLNEAGKDLTDLSFLTQPGLPTRTRGPGDEGLLGMLSDLGSGMPTRGPTALASADTKTPRGAVVMVPVEALAATGKEAAANITPAGDKVPEGSCAG